VASATLAGVAGLAVLLAIAIGRPWIATAAMSATVAIVLVGNTWVSLQLDQWYPRL
jgi:hypothetical protein